MLRIPVIRSLTAAVSAVVLSAAGVPTSAQASPAPAANESPRYCDITLAPLEPGQTQSRVISRECFSGKQQPQTQTAQEEDTDTLLMVWYQHMGWQGNYQRIKGSDPCDSSGYGIRNTGWLWGHTLSSYRVFNSCNLSKVYTETGFGGTSSSWIDGDVHHFGSTFNDNIWSIWIKRG